MYTVFNVVVICYIAAFKAQIVKTGIKQFSKTFGGERKSTTFVSAIESECDERKMLKMQWVFKRAEFDEVKQQAEFLKAA